MRALSCCKMLVPAVVTVRLLDRRLCGILETPRHAGFVPVCVKRIYDWAERTVVINMSRGCDCFTVRPISLYDNERH